MIFPKSCFRPRVYRALVVLHPMMPPSHWVRWATMRECSHSRAACLGAIFSMIWCTAMEKARFTTSSLPRITTACSTDTICRRNP